MAATKINVERLVRPDLLSLEGYAAPASLEELQARFGDRLVKLDQNENPYGCSPRVRQALASYDGYHAYPDVLSRELRVLLAEYAGVPPERIVLGNGGDEIIELTLRLLISSGDRVINCPPTFGYYEFASHVAGADVVRVNRRADFAPDLPAILAAIDEADGAARAGIGGPPKILFLTSPNNPTGNLVDEAALSRLLETGLLIFVDEAYTEFASRSCLPLAARHENLVILRTFSKWAGLAGLRLGYGIFPEVLARHVVKIKPSFNVNVAAQVAGKAALLDLAFSREIIARIVAERERLHGKLVALEFLRPYRSEANFIFCDVLCGDARAIKENLERQGILARIYSDPLLRNAIRFSIGTPAQTDILVASLEKLGEILQGAPRRKA